MYRLIQVAIDSSGPIIDKDCKKVEEVFVALFCSLDPRVHRKEVT